MNYSEVIELLHAGFNADEIRSMINPQNPQNNPQEPAAPEPTPAEPEPAPVEPEPAPSANIPEDSRFNQLNETMGKILSAIQAGNLARNSVAAIGNPSDINTEVDKIMSGLIRPETEKDRRL